MIGDRIDELMGEILIVHAEGSVVRIVRFDRVYLLLGLPGLVGSFLLKFRDDALTMFFLDCIERTDLSAQVSFFAD